MAVKLLDIKRTYPDRGMRLEFLADSKEDTLPTLIADVPGLTGAGSITPGSICYTPALDMCVMGNNGQWGAWN
nr:MAG TPA: hypothetical protein [Caudoviricetes sp.]